MEGLELFAGSSPAERALAAKLQQVQGELAEYKEEQRYIEARVSAQAHILRLLEGEPDPGMCSGCYLKLKRRVRALEAEHLSSAALAAPAPEDKPERVVQAEGLETGSVEGKQETGVEEERAARPVRTARRLPRQVEGERVNEGLAALTRIMVAPLQREHSAADSVAAVIDSTRLAAAAHGKVPSNDDGAAACAEGDQEESQGEVEVSSHSPSKGRIAVPLGGDTSAETFKPAPQAEEPVGGFQEDSGDCSVNGGLKEGGSEGPGQSARGQSPFDKSDYKSVVEDDLSSEEGSTARAGGEPVETAKVLVGRSLNRVLNLSTKSTGSSASSIVGPPPEMEKGMDSRGASSEGAAESEWKDAIEDEDDLEDDGDSRAPIVSPVLVRKEGEGVAAARDNKEEEKEHESKAGSEATEGIASALGGEAVGALEANETGEAWGGGNRGDQLDKGGEEGPADAGGTGDSGNKEESARVAEASREVADVAVEGGRKISGGGVDGRADVKVEGAGGAGAGVDEKGAESSGFEVDQDETELSSGQPAKQPEISYSESTADVDDINVDEVATEEPPREGGEVFKPGDEEVDGENDGAPQSAGSEVTKSVKGNPVKVRPRVAPTFTLFAALKDAAKTTQEGQSMHEAKQERMERLLRQKAEREAAKQELARQTASRKPALAEAGRGDLQPKLEKGKENQNPRGALEAVTSASGESGERDGAGPEAVPEAAGGGSQGTAAAPVKSFSQALASSSETAEPGAPAAGAPKVVLTQDQRKAKMKSTRDFVYMERDRSGRMVNILQGLELHENVLNADEQAKLVKRIYTLQEEGQAGKLMPRTYTQPRKWMRGKGRVTIQFGCCYNYAIDKTGNPPGIVRDEEVDPIPPIIQSIIKRMINWGVVPESCRPDSCIVNIYDEGDCIPPHIDHHDFLRPFCTLSLLSEANIVFGTKLEPVGEGEFAGPVRISLPVGSVLILNGNGADVAKHCIPGVPAKRISITLRKMDPGKAPYHLTQTAIHTPLPGAPLQPPPQSERGSSADSWRRAPEAQATHTRFASPAPDEKQTEDVQEAWPELGGEKKAAEDGSVPEVAAPVLKGAWGKRQEEKVETGGPKASPVTGADSDTMETASAVEQLQEKEPAPVTEPVEPSVEKVVSGEGDSKSEPNPEEKTRLEVKAPDVKPRASELGLATGPWSKVLASTLRAAAPPFEVPPKRLASPVLDAPIKKMVPYEKGASHKASFDSPPRSRGVSRPSSTSLTSSPTKKWAASTETPVAAASDLAMAVQKMVGGEGGQAVPRAEGAPRQESAPPEAVRGRAPAPSDALLRQGLGISAAAPEFAPSRKEGGVRPRSGDLETKQTGRAATAESLVDESASWADIEVDTGSPRRGGWQPAPRGASADRFDRPLERPLHMEALFERREVERRLRDPEFERALVSQYLRQNPAALEAQLAANRGPLLDPRLADRTGRVGVDGYLRERGGGLDRWGHDDRGLEQDAFRAADRRRALAAQDDIMYSRRGTGSDRREGGPVYRENGFGRQGFERNQRGERQVTHPKAEALREAGGW
ncbi:2-oxoglutarate (2OG) and Fe(II)-dependent oxygenase superfamily protein [Klebsormidium nitens]|uniref:2-oxoglutarate (2OG) and Fe(II)-dependent oxygenase superfamily protein n=1 Tax=Klebsormidium nitens TaxID=105231 RepID=A0A1Y1IPG2_KLENI|nr:2-oxoglutarate (2OG) and Fe(II)-dependent oxygenase superfamily protein [Klebsormidium nitens]|eukprot:GAQ91992.1 2-oxoglutarate (2OG) and Fe(II)-dependent oxygenase superfamily protein [Klebsormidium nitens]